LLRIGADILQRDHHQRHGDHAQHGLCVDVQLPLPGESGQTGLRHGRATSENRLPPTRLSSSAADVGCPVSWAG
jgi:hypothetical protein